MMSDDINENPTAEEQAPVENNSQEAAPEQVEQPEQPEWFKSDKYKTIDDQAKAYTDLEKRFGSFTGAPEAYEATISEELSEAGIELLADDPLMTKAMEFAKESNMSQEGFNGMVNLYAEAMLAENAALNQTREEEMAALGANAPQRIEGVNKFIDANLDAKNAEGLRGAIQTAAGLEAVEQLISRVQTAPVAPSADAAPSVTDAEVKEMYFALDDNGMRKINTDPSFKAEYERKRDALYGTGDFKQVIG